MIGINYTLNLFIFQDFDTFCNSIFEQNGMETFSDSFSLESSEPWHSEDFGES